VKDLLSHMLDRNPEKRLAQFPDIKEHPWLREVDWRAILEKKGPNGPVRVDWEQSNFD
jgi:hypothetical protein